VAPHSVSGTIALQFNENVWTLLQRHFEKEEGLTYHRPEVGDVWRGKFDDRDRRVMKITPEPGRKTRDWTLA
jgi:hypothetical protein